MNPSSLLEPLTLASIGIVVKVALVVAVAAVVTQALQRRRRSAASLHLVWAMAMASLLMLPLLSASLPAWGIGVAAIPAPTPAFPVATVVADAEVKPALASAAAATSSTERYWPGKALAALYLSGVLALLLRMVLGERQLRRLAARSRNVHDGEWVTLLGHLAPMTGVGRPVRLLYSSDIEIPMTWGTRHPVIFLPISAQRWPMERRRAVLLHELAHAARLDCLVQKVSSIVCALYWLHPAVWYAARRLRIERERACDDRVVAAGMTPRSYAVELFEVAQGYRPGRLAAAAALGMARPSELEGRMQNLLGRVRSRAGVSRRSIVTATLGTIAVSIPLACLQPRVVENPPPPDRWERIWNSASPNRGSVSSRWGSFSPKWSRDSLSAEWDTLFKARRAFVISGSSFRCAGPECVFADVEIRRNPGSGQEQDSSVAVGDSACKRTNQTHFEFQVDQRAEFIEDSGFMRTASPSSRGSGNLAIQFVVDSRGLPELGSLKVLRSGSAASVARMRSAFPHWRFTPARLNGCAVRQLFHVEVGVRSPAQ
ncbi:hypothetical protein BH23GEM1_BH23GEM1_03540 [soil metagenome]